MRVTYDRNGGTFDKLLKRASQKRCDLFVWTTTDAQLTAARRAVGDRAQPYADIAAARAERPDKEQQYYLFKSPLRYVPLTRPQATHVNAALGRGHKGWERMLSPRQRAALQQVRTAPKKRWPVAQGVPLRAAFAAFDHAAAK